MRFLSPARVFPAEEWSLRVGVDQVAVASVERCGVWSLPRMFLFLKHELQVMNILSMNPTGQVVRDLITFSLSTLSFTHPLQPGIPASPGHGVPVSVAWGGRKWDDPTPLSLS